MTYSLKATELCIKAMHCKNQFSNKHPGAYSWSLRQGWVEGGGGAYGLLERRKVIEKVHSYNYKWGLVY